MCGPNPSCRRLLVPLKLRRSELDPLSAGGVGQHSGAGWNQSIICSRFRIISRLPLPSFSLFAMHFKSCDLLGWLRISWLGGFVPSECKLAIACLKLQLPVSSFETESRGSGVDSIDKSLH
jgi:hypothetical protein